MKISTFVKLTIVSSNLTPEEIDSFVGTKCNKSWRIGEFREQTTIKEKNNGWILDSGLEEDNPIEAHLNALLKKLKPVKDQIQSLSKKNYVEFSCAIYAKEVPSLHFDKDIVHIISNLGASLDIDLYLT